MTSPFIPILEPFSTWAAASPLNRLVVGAAWVIPLVQVIHILCVSVVLASTLMVALRVFGLGDRAQTLGAVADRFLPALWGILPILLLTGLVLIIGEPTRAIYRTVFWAKMGMVLLAGGLVADVRRRARGGAEPSGALLKSEALVALVLWFAVVAAGRWIGYAAGWPGSPT